MKEAVVVVGPAAVCGPGVADADVVSVALECVDDRLAVSADRVVAVRTLWSDVVRAVCAGDWESVLLVVPSWWPRARIEFVEGAFLTACPRVAVRHRGDALLREASGVVELGPDCVVVHAPDGERSVVSRAVAPEFVADAVLATLPATPSVVIDAPFGVSGAATLADELARRLRRRNIEVSLVDDEGVRCASEAARPVPAVAPTRSRTRVGKQRLAVATGALAATAALAGAAAGSGTGVTGSEDGTWIVEGRVAVQVPAPWAVERLVAGPGSARVQVISPADSRVAIHVTQARVPDGETMQATAETLEAALDEQPDGVFTDFKAIDHSAGRLAVTYTEVRSAVSVDWVVLVDHGIRIAIGCQQPVAATGLDPACERAIRTARSVP